MPGSLSPHNEALLGRQLNPELLPMNPSESVSMNVWLKVLRYGGKGCCMNEANSRKVL